MCENFILDDGGVVIDEDLFNCQCGELCEDDATEGVGYAGFGANERED